MFVYDAIQHCFCWRFHVCLKDRFRPRFLSLILQCIPISGRGFVTGAYNCKCRDGYYFPVQGSDFYPGSEIEQYYREGWVITPAMFRCIACAAGCDTCIDSSPCLYERNEAVLVVFTVLVVATILAVMGVSFVTYVYKGEMVSIIHVHMAFPITFTCS